MDVVALSVAIVSLVLAALSLGWQIAQFLLTGARVKAGLKAGLLGSGGALVWPVTTRQVDVARSRQQGFTDPVFAIEVRNTGRMSIAVEQVKVRFEGWERSSTNQRRPTTRLRTLASSPTAARPGM